MSKTMVDTYKELAADDYETWKSGTGASKLKKNGANGTTTALDETENRAMYDLYVQGINAQNALNRQKSYLEESKQSALEANAQNRANTMQQNAIMTERAKDYVNRRPALNGTASAGASQTAMIDLMSQMAGARANAQATYDSNERSILQDYQDALYEAQNNYDTTMVAAQNTANAAVSNVAVERAGRVDTVNESHVTDVENALADYEAGNISFEELEEIYNSNSGYIDENNDYSIVDRYKKILEMHRMMVKYGIK